MLLQRGIFGDLTCRRRKKIGPGVGVRGPHLVPLCPETYARSFPIVGIVRFAQLHSPQVINRNFSKNDWDKQGMKFLDPVAGRWPQSGGET
jgi:hypothetical protein